MTTPEFPRPPRHTCDVQEYRKLFLGVVIIEFASHDDSQGRASLRRTLYKVLLNPVVSSALCGLIYKGLVAPHVGGVLPDFLKMPLTVAANKAFVSEPGKIGFGI